MSQYDYYTRRNQPRKNSHRRKMNTFRFLGFLSVIAIIIVVYLFLHNSSSKTKGNSAALTLSKTYEEPAIQAQLLDPNPYSRPQTALDKVTGVVVHYVGNPGTSAKANRDYFNGLAQSGKTYASSHFVVDLDGTIIQCIPLNEISYARNTRNKDTISIEVCHPDTTGKFTDKSYKALVSLVKWLCSKYDLNSDDVIRHYDVTGKLCPLYYVEHNDAWLNFKKDVFKE